MGPQGSCSCVRLRRDTLRDDWTAKDWRSRLQTGRAGLLVKTMVVSGQPINVVLTTTRDGDALIIARHADAVTTIWTRFRLRFLGPYRLLALKSEDFQLEGTHMALQVIVERLLCLLTLTYTRCVLVRITLHCPKKVHCCRA